MTNQKEKEVLSGILDPERKGMFRIEPFMRGKKGEINSDSKLALHVNLLDYLNELADFLEKSPYSF